MESTPAKDGKKFIFFSILAPCKRAIVAIHSYRSSQFRRQTSLLYLCHCWTDSQKSDSCHSAHASPFPGLDQASLLRLSATHMSTYCLRNFPDSPIRRPWFMNHSITTYVGHSTDGSCGVKHQHKININSSDSRTSVGYMHKKHHTPEWVNDEKPQSKAHIKPREPIGAFSTNNVPKIGHRRPR